MTTCLLGHIASLLVRFRLAHKDAVSYGWAPRILVQCGVPYHEVWDIFHEMYESQVCGHSYRLFSIKSEQISLADTALQRASECAGHFLRRRCAAVRLARGSQASPVGGGESRIPCVPDRPDSRPVLGRTGTQQNRDEGHLRKHQAPAQAQLVTQLVTYVGICRHMYYAS